MQRNRVLALIVVLAATFTARQASADVIYSYKGMPFTDVGGLFDTTDLLTGSLVVPDLLPDSVPGPTFLNSYTPDSWMFSVGTKIVLSSDDQNTHAIFRFGTINGFIIPWSVRIVAPGLEILSEDFGDWILMADGSYARNGIAFNGDWSATPVPEPNALALMSVSLGLYAWRRARRKRASV